MRPIDVPVLKDLVLVGGGHSHVAILKKFGMRPEPGVRLTLIARDVHTPYSGMLPGYIAGHYSYDEAHVDLRPLAQFAQCRLYHNEMIGLDPVNRLVLCKGRPQVPYDLLSIDIGSTPRQADVPGACEHALAIKPIDRFLAGWEDISRRALVAQSPFRIVIVGAGAGGVELSLSLQYRLRTLASVRQQNATGIEFHLLSDTADILPTHNAGVRRTFLRVLSERDVRVRHGCKVTEVQPGQVRCADGKTLSFDALIWVTHASAPAWIKTTGLATTDDGFIAVNEFLQSTSHADIFAAGDIATIVAHPRAKSGVIAVRSGPPLADNLRRALTGAPLKRFAPQRKFLALIGTGDRYAVASRGRWALAGKYVWRLKDWIDRRWMRGYRELPPMPAPSTPALAPGLAGADALKEISSIAMRCGGCGSKVGATVLTRVLARLPTATRADIVIGLADPDDAAVVEIPAGKMMVHTIDFFRSFVDDPYVFGAVAANHSLSDIYAMGAQPQSALAMAILPFGIERKVEQQLYELLAGAMHILRDSGALLVGGHTSEGAELSFGLSVNGFAGRDELLRKDGLRAGDQLILCKPLGTGTLFAADMRQQAKARWISAALESMLQSNRQAAECLRAHGVRACTDVTGFGLIGHLLEMTRPSGVDVTLDLNALPVLDGAADTLKLGIFSSLAPENVRLRRAIRNLDAAAAHPLYPLLFDPQTSGGLLGAVAKDRASACLAALHSAGYRQAAIVGDVAPLTDALEPVTLRL